MILAPFILAVCFLFLNLGILAALIRVVAGEGAIPGFREFFVKVLVSTIIVYIIGVSIPSIPVFVRGLACFAIQTAFLSFLLRIELKQMAIISAIHIVVIIGIMLMLSTCTAV